jgi:hypothetical protein
MSEKSVIRSPDQLTGQRFHNETSYSNDPELDAAIRDNINSSRHTIANLKPAELKRILRAHPPQHAAPSAVRSISE